MRIVSGRAGRMKNPLVGTSLREESGMASGGAESPAINVALVVVKLIWVSPSTTRKLDCGKLALPLDAPLTWSQLDQTYSTSTWPQMGLGSWRRSATGTQVLGSSSSRS